MPAKAVTVGTHPTIPISVFISGNGTNLQALIDYVSAKKLSARIIRVISNRKNAFGLQRAEKAGIPTAYHNLLSYRKNHPPTDEGIQAAREQYDADLAELVLQDSPELIVCLGFLHVLSRSFLDPINQAHVKIINLHPALPGAFNGSDALGRAHTAWMEGKIDKTGVMIHNVIAEVDMGAPILIKEIPFMKGVDEDINVFEQKLHQVEWGAVVEGTEIAVRELQQRGSLIVPAKQNGEES